MSVNNKEGSNRTFRMKAVEPKQVKYEKDIGVIIDYQLKIENHMNEKIKKANNMMGLIRRLFVHLYEAMFLNTTWYPYKIKDLTAIENVQRRATRYLPKLKGMPYEKRLKTLKLPALQYRSVMI